MDHIHSFSNDEPAFHLGEPHWGMVYNSFYAPLDSMCSHLVKDVYVYVRERYRSEVFL